MNTDEATVANAINQLNDAFDALRMANRQLLEADRQLRVEHERANRAEAKIARVEALAERLLQTYDCYDDDDMAVKEHIVPAIRAALAEPEEATDA